MSMEFASQEWAAALATYLEGSASVRTESMSWVFGPVHLNVDADPEHGLDATTISIELHEGSVRSVAATAPGDAGIAPFALDASLARWKSVFDGSLDIIDAIMQARIEANGDLPTLTRHRSLLAALAAAGAQIDTAWQDEREAAAASA